MSTKKAREFVGEPMGDKWAHDIPGIGPEYGARLAEQGLPKAANVFGQFLVHNGDRDRVVGWLKNDVGMPTRHAEAAYEGLDGWRQQNFS
ncbi:barrier to autointegration factor [Cooperia oncophora]